MATLTGTETLTNKTITTSGLLTALSDASFNTSISVGSNISLNGQILSKNVRAIQNDIYNLALGDSTQLQNINLASSNNFNYAFGYDNLSSLTTGGSNFAVGRSNISKETTGVENVAFGTNNLNKMVGSFVNVGIGRGNMSNAYYGYYNVGIGIDNLYNCSGGNNNTAIGLSSLYALTTGAYNTAIGYGALRTSATGSGNLGLGNNAGSNFVNGQNNSFIGPNSGPASGDSNTYDNSTAIGYGAVINASNQITIGTSSNNVNIAGNISVTGTVTLPAASIADSALSSNIVTLTGTQTLTNKTLTTSGLLTALTDASINNRLFVGSDVSLGGNLFVNKVLKPVTISESFVTNTGTTSPYTLNYLSGSTFYITTPPASNFTVNLTNVPTDINRTYIATLIITSTTNKTFCNSLQINGNTAITPNYANGIPSSFTSGNVITQSITIQRITLGDVSANNTVLTAITAWY